MKTVFSKSTQYKLPESLVSSSYAGACAGHQVSVHEDMFGTANFSEDFGYFYDYVKPICDGAVGELPKKVSLKEVVQASPANHEFGGF